MARLHTDEELKEAEKQGVGLAAVGMKEDGTLVGIFECNFESARKASQIRY